VCEQSVTQALRTVAVTPPTIAMTFGANDSPLAGKSGAQFLNSNQIKFRLNKEVENNVTIQLKPSPNSDQLEVREPVPRPARSLLWSAVAAAHQLAARCMAVVSCSSAF
jgi:hypothetical protein